MTSPQGINQRIADRLLADGQLDRDNHLRAVEYATRKKTRIEEALIELDIMSERDLLKFIATLHSTNFVSTEKLSKAGIDRRMLDRVPVKIADLYGVFPVLYDDKACALTVATADPDNAAALQEVKLALGLRDVRAIAARPAAVRAAIAHHYRGDRAAFQTLLRASTLTELGGDDPFGRRAAPRATGTAPMQPAGASRGGAEVPVAAPVMPAPLRAPKVQSTPPPAPVIPPAASAELIETLNVLISLLENGRPDLRGHSAMVARVTRKTCERIGLLPLQASAFVAAAYLHDLGKAGSYHLTALNVAEYDGHRIAAIKGAEVPLKLMESVGLLPETTAAVASMYERYDGQGFPNGQSGNAIPLGARILAVADTYADLTQNPRNPYRKILRPFEACEVLLQYGGKVFDPNIVELFRQAMTGEDMRAKLLSDRHEALIIDPDPEETTVLELRLIEQGFEVRIARAAAQARKLLEEREIDVVVSEIDLDKPDAGLALRESAQKDGFARDVTWVMLTAKTDRQTAQRAFDLGVDDFVLKPISTDIFVAKLRQLIERRASNAGGRGVSGSLVEMSLPDMVQILWHGRKTCALRISSYQSSGEIDFADGQVVDARWDALRGEDAFYRMLALREGDFRLDPTYTPGARSINASPEALLLEGMRRLDEATG